MITSNEICNEYINKYLNNEEYKQIVISSSYDRLVTDYFKDKTNILKTNNNDLTPTLHERYYDDKYYNLLRRDIIVSFIEVDENNRNKGILTITYCDEDERKYYENLDINEAIKDSNILMGINDLDVINEITITPQIYEYKEGLLIISNIPDYICFDYVGKNAWVTLCGLMDELKVEYNTYDDRFNITKDHLYKIDHKLYNLNTRLSLKYLNLFKALFISNEVLFEDYLSKDCIKSSSFDYVKYKGKDVVMEYYWRKVRNFNSKDKIEFKYVNVLDNIYGLYIKQNNNEMIVKLDIDKESKLINHIYYTKPEEETWRDMFTCPYDYQKEKLAVLIDNEDYKKEIDLLKKHCKDYFICHSDGEIGSKDICVLDLLIAFGESCQKAMKYEAIPKILIDYKLPKDKYIDVNYSNINNYYIFRNTEENKEAIEWIESAMHYDSNPNNKYVIDERYNFYHIREQLDERISKYPYEKEGCVIVIEDTNDKYDEDLIKAFNYCVEEIKRKINNIKH